MGVSPVVILAQAVLTSSPNENSLLCNHSSRLVAELPVRSTANFLMTSREEIATLLADAGDDPKGREDVLVNLILDVTANMKKMKDKARKVGNRRS